MAENGTIKYWITVIVSIVVSFISLSFGIVKGTQAKRTEDLELQLIRLEQSINTQTLRLEKSISDLSARVYKNETRYEVIIEKLDGLKESLKVHRESGT